MLGLVFAPIALDSVKHLCQKTVSVDTAGIVHVTNFRGPLYIGMEPNGVFGQVSAQW